MLLWACPEDLAAVLAKDDPPPWDVGTWAWFECDDGPVCPECEKPMIVATTDVLEALAAYAEWEVG